MNKNFDALGYYKILDVSPNAANSLIKQQYYERAKFWHPDHNEDPKALEAFQKVSVAYDVLKEQKSRLIYDLLCLVYTETDFPTIGSLKIYKSQNGKNDVALRVLKQRRVVKNLKGSIIKETKDICNFKEAKDMVISTSISNWLTGWWGVGAFRKNIEAIKFNINASSADDTDNLKLLIHNAIAYNQEQKIEMSWIYAKQALLMSENNSRAKELLTTFIDMLDFHPKETVILPYWSASELRNRQRIIPYSLLAMIGVLFFCYSVQLGYIKIPITNKSYYQEMEFSGGIVVPYDMIDSHIVKLDSSSDSLEHIFHFNDDVTIYHGPDTKYDVMQRGKKGQTVRIIGHTANNAWYKIIIDNGEMGYVHRKVLNKGVGNPVPARSKVYRN